jgi:prepilin peptidase CpaA
LALLFSALCLAAAVQDWRSLRISNGWSVALLGVCSTAIFLISTADWWQHLASFGIVLVVGIGLYGVGWFGAGDAKFFAAVAAAFPLGSLPTLVVTVVLLGGLMAVIRLLFLGFRELKKRQLPYGLPICGGAIASLLLVHPASAFFAGAS